MSDWIIRAVMIVPLLLLAGCLPQASPVLPRDSVAPTTAAEMPVGIETVEELRTYLDGEERVYVPRAGEAAEETGLLLDVLSELNLQALCMLGDDDIARMRAEQDSVELLFAQPVDLAIGQRIAEADRDHIPTDERGFRVLRLTRALFSLEGEMAGHVLVRDDEGNWGCWATERNGKIDTGWVETVRLELSPAR